MDRSALLETLERDAWFASLPADLVDLLLQLSVERHYQPNQLVYALNDPPSGTFGLLSGGIRMSHFTESGRHIVFATFSPGTWFGILSDFDGLPRPHNAVTVGPTRLLHLPSAGFRTLVDEHPHHVFHLARCLAVLTRASVDLLAETRTFPYPSRVAQVLLGMYDHAAAVRAADTDPRVTHEELAATVGVTRQTISRLLTDWEADGLIERRYGRIGLLDFPRLARIAAIEDGAQER